jgi:AraC family transcriptional activator of pobA
MDHITRFENIVDYNRVFGQETFHPLVSVIDFSTCKPLKHGSEHVSASFGFYGIFLKDVKCGDIKYGREYYDYQEGTLVFFAPDQVISVENKDGYIRPQGHALIFHPDMIQGTSLGRHIDDYTFFSYETREALHLSEKERKNILDAFSKIALEIERNIDKHSKKLIVNNIELMLNYCVRFYDRQFQTRDNVNRGIIEQFEQLLREYLNSEKPKKIGFPHVSYFAENLNLSANYFGDLVKKETGRSAQEYIQMKLIQVAKEKVFDTSKSISEIAYELGFKYPQHFSRMFRNLVGMSPAEFRLMN